MIESDLGVEIFTPESLPVLYRKSNSCWGNSSIELHRDADQNSKAGTSIGFSRLMIRITLAPTISR